MKNRFKYISLILGLILIGSSFNRAQAIEEDTRIIIGKGARIVNPKSGDITIGENATSPGEFSFGNVVIGKKASSSGLNSLDNIVIGREAHAIGSDADGTIAIGAEAKTQGNSSIAIGFQSDARGEIGSLAIGLGAEAIGNFSTAIGHDTFALGDKSLALGYRVFSANEGAMVIGSGYTFKNENGIGVKPLLNNKENSLAIGFNSDKATLFVGGGIGQGTTGNVGVGTDTPEAKLDVQGDIKAVSVSTEDIDVRNTRTDKLWTNLTETGSLEVTGATTMNTAKVVNAEIQKASIDKLVSSDVDVVGHADIQTASINNLVSANVDVLGTVSANEISVRNAIHGTTANIASISTNNLDGRSANFQELRSTKLAANKADISEMVAKEASMHNAKIREAKIYHSETKENLSENLFVGSQKDTQFESTALVAYEKVEIQDVKDTPEIANLKLQIQNLQSRAEVYQRLAKLFPRNLNHKVRADRLLIVIENHNKRLLSLVEEQGANAKKVARVGVGISDPQQTLHISGALRLEPQEYAPSQASMGDLYVDKSGALCVFLNKGWESIGGEGECNLPVPDFEPKFLN